MPFDNAREQDVEAMKDVLKTQGAEASFMLGQLYAVCGVAFTEDQLKEIKACEEKDSE